MMELPLAHGADVNAKDNLGGTPLHCAASFRGHRSAVELLVSHGADIDAMDGHGKRRYSVRSPMGTTTP
jgi:ankyrin repeat protein